MVHVIRLHTSHDPGLMHLLRCMHYFSAQFDINSSVEHVKGSLNTAADALSHNSWQAFFQAVPSATQDSHTITIGTVGTGCDSATGLEVSWLEKQAMAFMWRGLAPPTTKSYLSAQRSFCNQLKIVPLPAQEWMDPYHIYRQSRSNGISVNNQDAHGSHQAPTHHPGAGSPNHNFPRIHLVTNGI